MRYYRKKELQPMMPYEPGMSMGGVSVSEEDKSNGSPREGDMIAFNPLNPRDMWLVSEKFLNENYVFVAENTL